MTYEPGVVGMTEASHYARRESANDWTLPAYSPSTVPNYGAIMTHEEHLLAATPSMNSSFDEAGYEASIESNADS